MGGSLGEAHAETIVRGDAARRSRRRPGGRLRRVRRRAPAGGPRGARRLRADLPRRASSSRAGSPQISIVTGVSAGGGAYSPALTDFVVMTERARMFLTGPKVVERGARRGGLDGGARRTRGARPKRRLPAWSPTTSKTRRGGPATCSRYLPSPIGEPPPPGPRSRPDGATRRRRCPLQAAQGLRRPRRRSRRSSTAASCSSCRRAGRRNMVTALARIDGRAVGVIANQPRRLGGVIDTAAAEKGALFVADCDRFGLPLVVLVDTPGSCPARRQEERRA